MKFVNIVSFSMIMVVCLYSMNLISSDSKISSVNESPAKKIKDILSSGIGLTSPVANALVGNLDRLQNSEGRTRQFVSDAAAAYATSQVLGFEDGSPVRTNRGLLHVYQASEVTSIPEVRVIRTAASNLDESDRLKFTVVDIDHVLSPTPKLKGKKLTGFGGGHADLGAYPKGTVQTNAVLSQDGTVLSVLVGVSPSRTIKKTAYAPGHEADERKIITDAKNSEIVAVKSATTSGQDDLRVVETVDKKINGQYVNGLQISTQFPLSCADADERDGDNKITIATLVKLKSDGTGLEDDKLSLRASPTSFDTMMGLGSPLQSKKRGFKMVDITVPVQDRYKSDLTHHGYSDGKLPGSLYGVKRNRLED